MLKPGGAPIIRSCTHRILQSLHTPLQLSPGDRMSRRWPSVVSARSGQPIPATGRLLKVEATSIKNVSRWLSAPSKQNPACSPSTQCPTIRRPASTLGSSAMKQPATATPAPTPSLRNLSFWLDRSTWRASVINTLHCLVGCSIGDLFALYIFANYFPGTPMEVVMPVAMASGISSSILFETLRLKYSLSSMQWAKAVRTAFNMSFLSMLTMEAAENATNMLMAYYVVSADPVAVGSTVAAVSSAIPASSMLMMDLHHPYFALSLATSVLAGFLAPLPYNYYVVRRYNKRCH